MNKLILVVLAMPFAAQADVIRVEYEGTVKTADDENNYFGYIAGDPISGWFEYSNEVDFINQSSGLSEFDAPPIAFVRTKSRLWQGIAPVVSNQSPVVDMFADEGDQVAIQENNKEYKDVALNTISESFGARYILADSSTYLCSDGDCSDGRFYENSGAIHGISFFLYGEAEGRFDAFNGLVPYIDTNTASGYLLYVSDICPTEACTDGTYAFSDVRFTISSLRFSPVGVPEPGTLALLGIGLFSMGLVRRRMSA